MAVNPYVFIVGRPRSETILLQRIVDSHPDIAVIFETHSIPRWLEKRRGDYNLESILRWACPHLGAEIEETVGAVVASLEEVLPAPNHRDLKLDHILLDGDHTSLVGLDNFAAADPVLDVANVGGYDAGDLS